MKKYIYILTAACLLTACNDWLREFPPTTKTLEDAFVVGEDAVAMTTGCYSPLMYEQNDTYYPEWYIGDIMSDDALKGGGSIADGGQYYELDNFKINSDNNFIWSYYKAQYLGIQRCNLALRVVDDIPADGVLTDAMRTRLKGEIHFLRGFYYFRLVRIFGKVPKVDFVVENSEQWIQPRANVADLWEFVVSDFKKAEEWLPKKSEYAPEDLGRATQGVAQAMLLKSYLNLHDYPNAEIYGKRVIDSREYTLVADYESQFMLDGENGAESIFEIQYNYEGFGDYGWGKSSGNFTGILTRSRNPEYGNGWGFNHPTQNLYDEFENGDPRRDFSIWQLPAGVSPSPSEVYLGNAYLNRKTMWINPDGTFTKLAHQSRCPLNIKQIRYADVLLMYAEACVETGNTSEAEWALEEVRARARAMTSDPTTMLPQFPNYGITDLKTAIRHERRCELAMEGHRWFDLLRWGTAKETMDAYRESESPEVQAEMSVFQARKHELLPIPVYEMDRNKWTEQNPGY
ncbi:MAG: RagB/SusD family nutrient uptake outer membrane protein [Prevotellaceae bacterium]|jgi:hypothetical protein|nr:RagB/SusD family nutrient uptake outer membrane protein [Prevotellaceae bacterium]